MERTFLNVNVVLMSTPCDSFTTKKNTKYTHLFFLNDWLPWYKRLYRAVKYIFGYKCKYGHWDVWIMDEKDIGRLREMVERFESDNSKE